ncbi:HlyD family secretion protein [Massilia sp. YIM B02769]|uniref:HlyD family secretion protein n=1 Tax=Massilia sp. YIM B02769 TaxID=3050129 RepID=UPI0025B68A2D|nr:HlyD family secretion protein [Massilia sp. YIM B02769]MDN4058215.1 HlyD family secretion protein [Massilia sp. YIM B02769]
MSLPNTAKITVAVLLAAVLAGSAYSYSYGEGHGARQSTDDAYVTADFTLVAPKVAGNVLEVLVEDHQAVKKGQLLARIDDRDYVVAVDMAKADLAQAEADLARLRATALQQGSAIERAGAAVAADQATLTFARANEARYRDLSSDGSATLQDRQQAESQAQAAAAQHKANSAALLGARQQVAILRAQVEQGEAQVARSKAALEAAELHLSYTKVNAPIDGVVGQRSVRVGAYAQVGAAMLAIVPLQSAYVEANFRETQLARMRVGQRVDIAVDMLPGTTLHGHVASLAPASSVSFSPIAPDNATGNFTKVVQRLPVKIVIDPGQEAARLLKVGMSVTPTVALEG